MSDENPRTVCQLSSLPISKESALIVPKSPVFTGRLVPLQRAEWWAPADGALPFDEVRAVARGTGPTPAQIILARLLAQGDDIAPIPGTKRVARAEENTAADTIELSAEQVERLNHSRRPQVSATTKGTGPSSPARRQLSPSCS